ncbi:MAG: 16S rRNA (uracil(1498)-N(3))-methyltransferase [Clostridiales bacterium]|jgi:16S rRNA (uracil1498-N3)-methyltransferase|nr:16S rRNA (uracil(1498)-N(3))-methyltransferase [Clostridiales bacterium]
MEIKRFFIEDDKIKNGKAVVDNDEFFHMTKALRLKKGYKIILCTGGGVDYYAEIDGVFEGFLTAKIERSEINSADLPFLLTMLQAIPSKDKLDIIVQKAVETGVSVFVPVVSGRVNDKNVNLPRLRKIAKEAAKQCEANRLMKILPPVSFVDAVGLARQSEFGVMAYEKEREKTIFSFANAFKSDSFSAAFIVGAEGGFSEEECEYARARGIETVTLGTRILRCETAGIVVSSLISGLYENARKGG